MPESAAVNSMFGRIARRYDVANRVLSAGLDTRWRRRLVDAVRRAKPGNVLDLATGSGDVAFALWRALPRDARILGMDFCKPMLEIAERKKAAAGGKTLSNLRFEVGDGLALPLPDRSFDAVTIAFGLRNMEDRHRSLSEMKRVLRPGGRLFVLEFSQPVRWLRPPYFLFLRHLLPRIAGWVTGDPSAYAYLGRTIEDFPAPADISAEISAAGFRVVSAAPMTFGVVALHQAVS